MQTVMAESLSKAAFKATAAWLKLDKLVTALIVASLSALAVWWATGQPAWGALAAVGVSALLFVPLFVWNVLSLANQRFAQGELSIAEANVILKAMRDPDGIYQHGFEVGKVTNGQIDPSQGLAFFDQIYGDCIDCKHANEGRKTPLREVSPE